MSVQATTAVWRWSEARYGERLVLLAIADSCNPQGKNAQVGIATIAREARLSLRQTQNCLRLLETCGELVIRWGEGPHGQHVYDLSDGLLARGANPASTGPEASGDLEARVQILHPAISDAEGCNLRQPGVQSATPDPNDPNRSQISLSAGARTREDASGTFDELEARKYALGLGWDKRRIDAELKAFLDNGEARGWMMGRTPVANRNAAWRGWCRKSGKEFPSVTAEGEAAGGGSARPGSMLELVTDLNARRESMARERAVAAEPVEVVAPEDGFGAAMLRYVGTPPPAAVEDDEPEFDGDEDALENARLAFA